MEGAEAISARLMAQAWKLNSGTDEGQPRLPPRHICPALTFHAWMFA
jgi:hypothetical protein